MKGELNMKDETDQQSNILNYFAFEKNNNDISEYDFDTSKSNIKPIYFRPQYNRLTLQIISNAQNIQSSHLHDCCELFEKDATIREYIENLRIQGYIEYVDENEKLKLLKVVDLKNILKIFNLKTSGKKIELIERIRNNILIDKFSCFLPEGEYLTRTNKGEELYSILLEKKDREMDILFSDIMNCVNENEYKLASMFFEEKKQFEYFPQNNEYHQTLDFINPQIPYNKYYEQIKQEHGNFLGSCIISYIIMRGVFPTTLLNYCKNNNFNSINLGSDIFDHIRYEIGKIENTCRLENYKNSGYTEYEILTSLDCLKETHAEMEGLHFKIKDADFGVNCPPFTPECKCVIIFYINREVVFREKTTELQERLNRIRSCQCKCSVKIIETSERYIYDLDEGDKNQFDLELFKHDCQKALQKMFINYDIEFVYQNDRNFAEYPKIIGAISDEESSIFLEGLDVISNYLTEKKDYF